MDETEHLSTDAGSSSGRIILTGAATRGLG
jgi:hypothetical protein